MDSADQPQKNVSLEGGEILAQRAAGTPGAGWWIAWTLLTTAAIPAALIAMTPLAVMFFWLINLGAETGLWPVAKMSSLTWLGFVTGLALTLSAVQWILLRNTLPRARMWFIATAAGVLLGGLAIGLALGRLSAQSWNPEWTMAAALLPFGLILGLAQWLYLRRVLPNAFWIIVSDVLATGSILLVGGTINNLIELAVLFLPGAISGAGMWFLLHQSRPETPRERTQAIREKRPRFPRLAWIGIGMVALVPLFFACSWIYAASHLALAKNEGIYPTVEDAVVEVNSQGWGDANVVSIEDVQVGPNRDDGVQPHVWFAVATVRLDRVPQGLNKTEYFSGSFYLRVRDGWVHMSEGAFPEFIGWVMQLYNMEGVR